MADVSFSADEKDGLLTEAFTWTRLARTCRVSIAGSFDRLYLRQRAMYGERNTHE